jgi:hypothetical protein
LEPGDLAQVDDRFQDDDEDDVFNITPFNHSGPKGFVVEVLSTVRSWLGKGKSPRRSSWISGREVGDDRVDLSSRTEPLLRAIFFQENVLRMKTSINDTFISEEFWNFCEVTNALPSNPNGSFDFARKSGTLDDLEYTDTPPLRVLLDVAKGDKSHSSTVVGKSSMLGNRMRTPRTEHKLVLELASYLQDGYLRTSRSPDPKYMPYIVGGANCTGLFGDPYNIYLSIKAYRGGGYDRVYGSAVNEARASLRALDSGGHSALVLCKRLRDKQEYLHGTYAEQVLIPPRELPAGVPGRDQPQPLLEATGGSNVFASVENRLLRARVTLTESQAIKEISAQRRIHSVLFATQESVNQDNSRRAKDSRERRVRFENALQANSAFQNLLRKTAKVSDVRTLQEEGFLNVRTGLRTFSIEEARWLSSGGRSEFHSLADLTSSEAMYARDEVTDDSTMKVGGIIIRPLVGGVPTQQVTSRLIGLYEINESQRAWALNLVEELRSERDARGRPLRPSESLPILIKDREWVNDDSLLIQKCLLDAQYCPPGGNTAAVLISDDKRLANQMAETANVFVYRIPSKPFVQVFPAGRVLNSKTKISFSDLRELGFKINFKPGSVLVGPYLDTGSVMAAASRMTRGEGANYKRVFEKTVLQYGRDSNNDRFSRYQLKELVTGDILASVKLHRPKMSFRSPRYGGLQLPLNVREASPASSVVSWRSKSDSSGPSV